MSNTAKLEENIETQVAKYGCTKEVCPVGGVVATNTKFTKQLSTLTVIICLNCGKKHNI